MKKIAILLLVSLLSLALSACNTGIESNISSDTAVTTTTAATTAPMTTTALTTAIPQTTAAITTAAATAAPAETTTTAAQEAAQTEAQTTTTVQTTPAPEWTESAASGTMYINTSCYSRKKAVIGAETVKLYNVNDKVIITAKTDTGYYKLDTGAFVHRDYLSNDKVTVQTTTSASVNQTTANTPAPAPIEETPFTVYAQHEDCVIYGDIECTKNAGGCGTNVAITAIETIKTKGLYKVDFESSIFDTCYVKMSDFAPTKVYIDPIFNSPLDIAAIKQYIIDYGTKELGLEYHETQNKAYGYDRPGGCWFVPRDIEDGDEPAWLKKVVEESVSSTKHLLEAADDNMNSFSVWIREVRDGEETDGFGIKQKGVRMFEIYILYY